MRGIFKILRARIFREARQRAGILKEVSIHALRHSLATHLLESGRPAEVMAIHSLFRMVEITLQQSLCNLDNNKNGTASCRFSGRKGYFSTLQKEEQFRILAC